MILKKERSTDNVYLKRLYQSKIKHYIKRKMKKRKALSIITLSIITICMFSGRVNAAVQSRPNVKSLTSTTANDFFEKIRKMEAEGGTLGKSANIQETTYLDTSNNGVDVHMAKNTEWGAAAMLAASAYGSAPSGKSDATTTGNATGIYQMADGTFEYVAGIYDTSNQYMSKLKTADDRYVDKYTDNVSKRGDATLETKGWKNSSSAFVSSSSPVFVRSYTALFGVSSDVGYSGSLNGSRAVLCVGSGL